MLLERKKREREELDKIERAALALLPDERRKKKKVKRDKKETATYGLDSQAFAPVDASIAGTERLRKGLSALERIPSYSLPDIRDMSGKGKLVANGPQGGSGAEDQAVAVPTPTSSSASASASASTSVPTDGGRRPVRTAHAARHRFRVYDRVHEKARVSDIPAMFTYAVAQEVILAVSRSLCLSVRVYFFILVASYVAEFFIRQLRCSSIIQFNITSIVYNHNTDYLPFSKHNTHEHRGRISAMRALRRRWTLQR